MNVTTQTTATTTTTTAPAATSVLLSPPTSWFDDTINNNSNNEEENCQRYEDDHHCQYPRSQFSFDALTTSTAAAATTTTTTTTETSSTSGSVSAQVPVINATRGGHNDNNNPSCTVVIDNNKSRCTMEQLLSDGIIDEPGLPPPVSSTIDTLHAVVDNHMNQTATASAVEDVLASSSKQPQHQQQVRTSAVTGPSPSWMELSQEVLPKTIHELFCTAVHRVWYSTQTVAYTIVNRKRRLLLNSDYGNSTAGYHPIHHPVSTTTMMMCTATVAAMHHQFPSFSTLPWIERQMVEEWRSYLPPDTASTTTTTTSAENATTTLNIKSKRNCTNQDNDTTTTTTSNDHQQKTDASIEMDDDDMITSEFDRARTLIPKPLSRPKWKLSDTCHKGYQIFGPTCLRHHCRRCGDSFCHAHSHHVHVLQQYGYHPNVPERVCEDCKRWLLQQNLMERIMWRLARCRDHCDATKILQPYFDIGYDSFDQMIVRITQAALTMAKSIPLGAQATVAVETVDVLRKYGLNGIYTIMLRQEFLSAANLLLQALGINRTAWPLSVHELSAAIFYALAQHRAMRGLYPEQEHLVHTIRNSSCSSATSTADNNENTPLSSDFAASMGGQVDEQEEGEESQFIPVCDALSDTDLMSLLRYAPIALNFIYIEKEVDMQLLAAQQGWRLLYAYLDQADIVHMKLYDRPASAIFVHDERKIACLAVRGTTTIHDVITDIRQVPVPFPDFDTVATATNESTTTDDDDEEWTSVFRGNGLAASGMVGAAINLYREHIDSLLLLSKQGYRIRLTGHSLGGSVAVLLGVLVYKDLLEHAGKDAFDSINEADAPLRVYSYGTPSCVDLPLAEAVEPFVTTVVLHDDVVPRLTPSSCRGLLKHLLHIRETWVKEHLRDDIRAFTDRAKTAWAPRWRPGFTLSAKTSVKLKRYCRKHIQHGKSHLRYVKDRLVGDDVVSRPAKNQIVEHECDFPASPLWNSPQNCTRDATSPTEQESKTSPTEQESKLVIDFIGGVTTTSDGMVVDGEEYFDPGAKLLDTGDNDSETTNDIFDQSLDNLNEQASESQLDADANPVHADCDEILNTVVLDEVPLPRMFIPGKIVHIYSHRGVYRASYVPRTFRDLRRISLAGNMLSDHKTKMYFDALSEVANVRRSPENPPRWTAFDEDDTCSCCASRFTWASTSDNEAQEARDKHNCRSCGSLVCEPCSLNCVPIPSIGLTNTVRVCDRCYNDSDGLLNNASSSKYTPTNFNLVGLGTNGDERTYSEKPERHRQKRSVVVDELAQRVQSSGLACG